jgi:hypothetical protein
LLEIQTMSVSAHRVASQVPAASFINPRAWRAAAVRSPAPRAPADYLFSSFGPFCHLIDWLPPIATDNDVNSCFLVCYSISVCGYIQARREHGTMTSHCLLKLRHLIRRGDQKLRHQRALPAPLSPSPLYVFPGLLQLPVGSSCPCLTARLPRLALFPPAALHPAPWKLGRCSDVCASSLLPPGDHTGLGRDDRRGCSAACFRTTEHCSNVISLLHRSTTELAGLNLARCGLLTAERLAHEPSVLHDATIAGIAPAVSLDGRHPQCGCCGRRSQAFSAGECKNVRVVILTLSQGYSDGSGKTASAG